MATRQLPEVDDWGAIAALRYLDLALRGQATRQAIGVAREWRAGAPCVVVFLWLGDWVGALDPDQAEVLVEGLEEAFEEHAPDCPHRAWLAWTVTNLRDSARLAREVAA